MKVNVFIISLYVASVAMETKTNSPTLAYLSPRNEAITIESRQFNDEYAQRALDILQAKVRVLIGPINVKGFRSQGTNHLMTLTNETGYGRLDGFAATSLDGKTQLVVTTKPLLQAWLTEHRHWQKSAKYDPPADIASAFRSEKFYTQAISYDAAVYKLADLSVMARSPGTLALAILFAFGRDEVGPNSPDMLAVSITLGERVFIFTQAANVG
ncbi:hypothetical protein [Pseudomonas fluorescens]|uniref:Uncharacterized protein n=1 Tax=Pseudomonas fluorescens TaxID=294 RepID=A0A5E7PSS6_PSEFL|nr:hypothetical protein [Pseudomonas fluorescens]VVP52140.1 hypothetical protein PS880_05427 [Pseudomonas fluorescens]